MDNENASNSKSESFPEKVDAGYVGIRADMIERVGVQEEKLTEDIDTKPKAKPAKSIESPKKSDEEEDEEEEFIIPERFSKNGRRKAVSFPLKLMKILSKKENQDIICWLPGGKSFAVVDQETFTAQILPTMFKKAKYTSFTRKLLRWGFTRIKAGTYTHEQFQKNRLDLVEQMTCKSKTSPTAAGAMVNVPGHFGYPGQMNPFHLRMHQQSMGMGGGGHVATMAQHEGLGGPTHQQDALNAVDREIERVRRLLQEKRMQAAASMQMQQQFPPSSPQAVRRGLSLPQQQQLHSLGLSPSITSTGLAAAASSATLSNPELQQAANAGNMTAFEIELEVQRRLRLREQQREQQQQGLGNIGIMEPTASSSMAASLNPGAGLSASSRGTADIATMAMLREQQQQALNRVQSLREQQQELNREAASLSSTLPTMPLATAQQQLQQMQQQQQLFGTNQWGTGAAGMGSSAYNFMRGGDGSGYQGSMRPGGQSPPQSP